MLRSGGARVVSLSECSAECGDWLADVMMSESKYCVSLLPGFRPLSSVDCGVSGVPVGCYSLQSTIVDGHSCYGDRLSGYRAQGISGEDFCWWQSEHSDEFPAICCVRLQGSDGGVVA